MPNLGVFLIFWISDQPFINKIFHNSTTNHDIDMKPGPVTKLEKKTLQHQKVDNYVMFKEILMPLSFF